VKVVAGMQPYVLALRSENLVRPYALANTQKLSTPQQGTLEKNVDRLF
jgi:hypothetical protein